MPARHIAHAVAAVLQPLGDWHGWVTVKDYPVEAVIAAQEGVTSFALPIDANGLPTDCQVTKSSGSKILDDQTCAIMLIRARFRPPVDKRGRPIAATYRQAIRWRLPPAAKPELVVDRSFEAISTIAPNGNVIDCRLTGPGAVRLGLAKGSCGPFGERGFLTFLIKDQYAKTRSADVRLSVTFEGASPPQLAKQPNVYLTLAKAAIEVGTDGKMTSCTSETKLASGGKTLDLCEFVKADPPRFPPQPTPRKATLLLDLSAAFD
ncbi:TonB family protein [Sphingomonas vulcanisoli]|uniref:TonB family protein n=1 Tax=Sphingomonas vulcanisoli TaxID=1658060 RepID=A0ABX0TRT1_9SPHN|nr:energy transducer TonB [Sphingomonas vulcanisoli]NIJ08228.1 TonB family protein [Sphingomonas vulcanisoli]